MGKKDLNKKKLKRSHRRLIRFFAISLFILVFLQVGLYFGSDLLLRNYVQQQVDKASGGKYEVSFDRFNLSIFQRGFYFEGFTLTPSPAYLDSALQKPVYKVQVPQIAVKGLGYNFSKKILKFGSIRFVNPTIQTKQNIDALDSISGTSKLEQLQVEIKKSLEDVQLEEIIIEELYLDQADLLIENFVSQKSIKAENTNFHLKEVLLLHLRPQPTPFNAAGFELSLENFEMLLSDSVHTLSAKEIEVSSLENHIRAKEVMLDPDLSRPSMVFYQMKLDDLELTDADINQVFYTTDVAVGKLNLRNPEFLVYSELTPEGDEETSLLDYSLYPLIKDILASISIDQLEIKEGKFLQRGVQDEYKNRIEAERVDFEMSGVYIGPDLERSQNQFFYADEAALTLKQAKVVLSDDIHWVTGEHVFISSKADEVKVTGAKVEPFRDIAGTDEPLFEFMLPEFHLEKANLKKVYNENILDVEHLVLLKPSVKISNVKKSEQNKSESFKGQTIKELTKNYLKAIYIKRLELVDGNMILNNKLKINRDSISFEKASMVLEDFAVDEAIGKDTTGRMFLAKDLQLELDNYAMKLTDDLHLFRSDKIFVDTKEKMLKIEGFRFEPLHPNEIMENLARLQKKTVLDVHVPEFYIKDIDISKAYFDGVLEIGLVEVPSPDIKLSRYVSRATGQEKMEISDLYTLATSYFSSIKVDSVSVIDGSIAYDNFVNDRIKTFAENDVSIRVKNFYMDENVAPINAETFFAEELDISLKNYVFNIAEGKYTLHADRISYNSSQDALITSNVRLRPRRDLGTRVTIGANISNLSFRGVDVDRFFFENTLAMSKVQLSDAEVHLYIDRKGRKREEGTRPRRRNRNLPKRLDVIQIDTVEAQNARFNVLYGEEGTEQNLISSAVNLSFFGFLLDSAKLREGDIAGFFDNMAMDIADFNLSLKDSIHTISFNKVELDTKSDLIQLQNLKVEPKTFSGKPGKPIIAANVPEVRLKTKSLTSLQETGEFDIMELVLDHPDISLYLDKKGVVEAKKKGSINAVQHVIENLSVDEFKLVGGNLHVYEKDSSAKVNSFEGLNIALNDLSFNLSKMTEIDKSIFLNKDFSIELPDYEIKLPDSLNVLKIGLVVLSKGHMELKDVQMEPRYGKYEYVRRVGFQTDVVRAQLPGIVFEGINLEKLIEQREIVAQTMVVNSPHIHVFRDKRVPFNDSIYRPMPQELMREAGLKMELDTFSVHNGVITYEEFPEKGMVPGSITFDSLSASIFPFYLAKNLQSPYPVDSGKIVASARINGKAPVELAVMMSYHSPYPMKVKVHTGKFDLRSVNSIMQRNAFLKIREGMAQPSSWTFTASDELATGQMEFLYNGLKVQLLDDRTLEKASGRKAMLSFVLNTFAVRGNNPRKLFNRKITSPIYYQRDKRKFIFNYWWKTSLSGFQGALGLGEAGPAKKEEEEDEQ